MKKSVLVLTLTATVCCLHLAAAGLASAVNILTVLGVAAGFAWAVSSFAKSWRGNDMVVLMDHFIAMFLLGCGVAVILFI